ncbi:hypothetical protein VTK73DRAFT_418 [Phialemonium thermophilum]|uniref:Uncharacterized protein n=1 Tax=Phialemonium thermophilum TaxID=223376 RepID=A0ABR3VVA7_9PEZI
MLYCLASLPDLADEIVNSAAGAGGSSSSSSNAVDSGLDALQDQMQAVSNILSAAAETWPDAKRSRDVLDDVAAWTLRLLRRAIASRGNNQMATSSSAPAAAPPLDALPGMTLPTQTLSHHHHHHHHHHHQQQQQQQQQQHQQQGAWAPFPPGPASPMPPMPPLSPLSQQQQGPDQQQQVLRPGNGFEVDRSYADLFSTLFPIDGGPSPIDEDLVMQGIFRDYQPIVDFDVGFDLGLHAGAGADLTNAG